MERRAHCRLRASPLACSRAGHCTNNHFAPPVTSRRSQNYCPGITTYYYLITTLLLHYYFIIAFPLLQHYYSFITTYYLTITFVLLHNYYTITSSLLQNTLLHIITVLLHHYFTITSPLLHLYAVLLPITFCPLSSCITTSLLPITTNVITSK